MNDDEIRPTGAPQRSQTRPCHRILVADDATELRQLMTFVLARSGYHVDSAEDGAIAWAALQARTYDLLITDHNMPKVTGVELVKNLRSVSMDVPVVMVTGTVPSRELAQNPSLQLAATLEKPFDLAELLDTVKNALRATESSRERAIHCQPGEANPQATFCGYEDSTPRSLDTHSIDRPLEQCQRKELLEVGNLRD
jgi:DNA-binding response OmpR family regulator